MFSGGSALNVVASLIGITALIFVAKGYVLGQVLTVVFAVFYGVISIFFRYYGELITYMGMTAPIAALTAIEWNRHPYQGTREVEVKPLSGKAFSIISALAAAVTFVFYFILRALGTQNLLDAARRAWVNGKDEQGYPTWRKGVRYHQVSTDEVYGSLGADGYFTEETPLCPHSPYSASKTSADLVVMAYRDTYKMPVSITRCSNNYGPYHFPEKLIPLIIKNILEGKKLPVYGDGSNVRDWLYVEDHCKAIDMVVREGREGEVYNVGGHNEKTNLEIVKLTIATIHRLMTEQPVYREVLKKKEKGADGQIDISWINEDLITFVKDRLGHDQRYAIDPTKIKNELGWYPETCFETGIVKTIEWYLNNQPWVEEVTSGDYQNYYERMYGKR